MRLTYRNEIGAAELMPSAYTPDVIERLCRYEDAEENGYDAFDEDGVVKYGEVIGNIHDNPELLGGISNEKDN